MSRCARSPRRSRATPTSPSDLVLAIVGGPSGHEKGAEVARLLELAAALGVSDRVMLFPPQPQPKLVDFYAAADVVLVPSRSESFGLVALEAQACGTPVVAADVGGLPLRGARTAGAGSSSKATTPATTRSGAARS